MKHYELSSWFVIVGMLALNLLALVALITLAWAIVYVFIVIYEWLFGLIPPLPNIFEFNLGIDFNSTSYRILLLLWFTVFSAMKLKGYEDGLLQSKER